MGEPNNQLDFVRLQNRLVFAAQYVDPGDSVWRISAVGQETVIEDFVEARDLRITLEPLDDDGYEPPPPPEELAAEMQEDYEPPEVALYGLPGLELKLELLQAAISGPRRVRFELDPPLEPQGRREYWFQLGAGDTTASVGFSGDISLSVTLEGSGLRSSSGGNNGTVSVGAKGGSWWIVRVANNTANSGNFSLTGDFLVF